METPILHHYEVSPYAEKARLMLGMKGLAWRSVEIPIVMPKPDLTALTGGYRKTPVLQIGADIYCDTKTIARVLERVAPEPTLYPPHTAAADAALSVFGDALFMAGVLLFFGAGAFPQILGPRTAAEFIDDRQKMFPGGFEVEQATALVPTQRDQVRLMLSALEEQLGGTHRYLLGDEPSHADFSVYHPVWLLSAYPLTAEMVSPFPRVIAWQERLAAFGHGQRSEMESAEAVEIARRSVPATEPREDPGDANGRKPGDRIRVMPQDYGMDPVEGELVASDAYEIAIRRTDERAGELVVHFPRQGYVTLPGG
jgi:glutathione S-transferase